MLPDEIKSKIFFFADIKCHSCLSNCCVQEINYLIKQGKFYYCSEVCYNFI